ncbi:MAG: hypothetical protein WCI73_11540 [Phycisphaerae bacterium]
MKILSIIIVVIFVAGLAQIAGSQAVQTSQNYVSFSWQALELELTELRVPRSTAKEFQKSSLYKAVYDQPGIHRFNEMINQEDNPLVAIAGVAGIADKKPELAYLAALRAFALTRRPQSQQWVLLVDMLQKETPNNDIFAQNFEEVCGWPIKPPSFFFLVYLLPQDRLE